MKKKCNFFFNKCCILCFSVGLILSCFHNTGLRHFLKAHCTLIPRQPAQDIALIQFTKRTRNGFYLCQNVIYTKNEGHKILHFFHKNSRHQTYIRKQNNLLSVRI
ncbi:hypothetical protein EUGRSUZ_K01981 [Eucalyptus grandis]|uniref:Uncharacterized protein n=1 Tax=Eucalyptus grandis TaxID=71139 RepID=A0ACC3IUL9_EUCGR|nr:hypothetical protein EUGRSUZ_K01981 [Eucalyptus grandis]